MRHVLALLMLTWPVAIYAQGLGHEHSSHGVQQQTNSPPSSPAQHGQSAFAAIQEIVEILEKDPDTNWSQVNINALRYHLVDMSNVTLSSVVAEKPVEGGQQFSVSGNGPVVGSIQRMLTAHAVTMNGINGWTFRAASTGNGATLTVFVPAQDIAKLRTLGFYGVMTRGMHHQEHHLRLARGANPHH